MKRSLLTSFIFLIALVQVSFASEDGLQVKLPEPDTRGDMSVEQAIDQRRSLRDFSGSLSLADISQLLWAAQGVTDPAGYRAAPSAGALYPLEVYLLAANVDGLPAGVYRYHPAGHKLKQHGTSDLRAELADAARGQFYLASAPAVLVFTGVYQRTMQKYGERGRRYVHMDVGHAAENVYLQAQARDLGTVIMGAFDDARVQQVLALPDDHEPLALMPVGRK